MIPERIARPLIPARDVSRYTTARENTEHDLEEEPMVLGLTMEEIQQVIAEAAETTPDIGPEGDEMSDPEYVTAYLLNIIIPLMRYNNQRMEDQLRAVGIAVPTI